MRSASERWAMEKMETRGLPCGVCRKDATSSGSPALHAEKLGEANRLLMAMTSLKRSFAG